MSHFKQWLDLNRQELMDWYCEGTMVDKDFLTRVEEFAEKAWEAGEERVMKMVVAGDWIIDERSSVRH